MVAHTRGNVQLQPSNMTVHIARQFKQLCKLLLPNIMNCSPVDPGNTGVIITTGLLETTYKLAQKATFWNWQYLSVTYAEFEFAILILRLNHVIERRNCKEARHLVGIPASKEKI
jgi:hypothetical protein